MQPTKRSATSSTESPEKRFMKAQPDPAVGGAVEYLLMQARAVGPQNGREESLSDKCAAYLREALEERQHLRDALEDIAKAHPSECDQTPWWAQKALCPHYARAKNHRGELECDECHDCVPDSTSATGVPGPGSDT
jgi:hypothetical protein